MAKIVDGKIKEISISEEMIPDHNEVCFPDDWGSERIDLFMNGKIINSYSDKHSINEEMPDNPLFLREI